MIRKTQSASIASGTVVAGGATSTGTAIDLRQKYGATIVFHMLVGASALSSAPNAIIEVSKDNVTWREVSRVAGPTAIAASATWRFQIEPEILWARAKFINGGTNTTTVEAIAHQIDAIG